MLKKCAEDFEKGLKRDSFEQLMIALRLKRIERILLTNSCVDVGGLV
jgi:hypothetical protein